MDNNFQHLRDYFLSIKFCSEATKIMCFVRAMKTLRFSRHSVMFTLPQLYERRRIHTKDEFDLLKARTASVYRRKRLVRRFLIFFRTRTAWSEQTFIEIFSNILTSFIESSSMTKTMKSALAVSIRRLLFNFR